MDSGGRSVMMALIQLMLMLLVDNWDIQTTITIIIFPCMSLNYIDSTKILTNRYMFRTGTSSQPIWLTNVPCSSSNTSCLVTCGRSCPSSQVSNCGHSKDVTLECGKNVASNIIQYSKEFSNRV